MSENTTPAEDTAAAAPEEQAPVAPEPVADLPEADPIPKPRKKAVDESDVPAQLRKWSMDFIPEDHPDYPKAAAAAAGGKGPIRDFVPADEANALACPHEGCEFVGKTAASLKAHIRAKHV